MTSESCPSRHIEAVSDGNLLVGRLRQTDIKAGHFERKVAALQGEVDSWEKKYEEMATKYKDVQAELEAFRKEIEGL